ncbi:MAG TPA: PHB depolymerase family esterase [Noviherbaspirillum sp.]|nr:PHB depolymerase family esterase [Noviherbaspirillum sp.]
MKINEGFLAQMREATRLLQSEGPMAATAAIQRALHGAAATPDAAHQADWTAYLPKMPELHDINTPHVHEDLLARFSDPGRRKWAGPSARQPVENVEVIDIPHADEDLAGKGQFVSGSCTNRAGTRAYKLYIPSGYKEEALPLVVMLHGCTQNPDDFAAGTGMNKFAEENNCFVVYPAQAKDANGSQCWNWFQTAHQRRDEGEPSIIADITREVIRKHKVDTSRIYVAGLSAGGAMAAVMAATYPELYAAAGIHSGLPYGIAHDMPSAFAAMKHRKPKGGLPKVQPNMPKPFNTVVPTIVFHGDRDTTVHPLNGDQVLSQCVPVASEKNARIEVQEGVTPTGRTYTKSVVRNEQDSIVAEKWIVHGAGHAWSGGSNRGSYTDPKGPNASAEMMRFFLAHRRTT